MAEPSNDKKERKRDHEDGDSLSPKTTGEFVLNWRFLGAPRGFRGSRGSSGALFCGFSFASCHGDIIAHF